MEDDEWVKAAMMDDSMVANMLLRLKQSDPPEEKISVLAVVPLKWGVRQPRSILRCDIVQNKKQGESIRASPTTPLSWSGETSLSGGAGGGGDVGSAGNGHEESSLLNRPNGKRSKVPGASETPSKRSRKKKTLLELKEEESLLLKERINLKKDLATLQISFQEHRARNKILKRMKLDLQSQLAKQTDTMDASKEVILDHFCHTQVDHAPTILQPNGELAAAAYPSSQQPDSCEVEAKGIATQAAAVYPSSQLPDSCEVQDKDIATQETFFALPDLNFPIEEDSGSEDLYGMS